MRINRRPLFIECDGRQMFVWHHVATFAHRRHAAVVMCPPLGYEYMSAYATWRELADRLAAAGFDTIRLDYDGTGNSAGCEHDSDRLAAWRRSIDVAIDAARRSTGSSSVALIGLRIGALLALDVGSARGDIDRIVLWNPFASGRAYLREMKAQIALAREADAADEPSATGMNVSGYLLTDETVKTLEQWTLSHVAPRFARDVLLVDHDERPITANFETQLTHLGARVTKIRGTGTADMLQIPHQAQIPTDALDQIVQWLSSGAEPLSTRPSHADASFGCDAWRGLGFHERAIHFGPEERLFGVMTVPDHATPETPALLLLNTAVEYHIGPHRLYVPLARDHAASGNLVFRFDFGGIGDSDPPTGKPRNKVFPDHMMDDLREAIAVVRREAPARPIAVAGLCSGAWLAFDAARQGMDIDTFVAINPPLFIRDDADGKEWASHGAELERYQQSVWVLGKWLKSLGNPSVGLKVVGVLAKTARRRIGAAIARLRYTPRPGTLAADLSAIARGGIKGRFVFSHGDAGAKYLQLHAATVLRRKNISRLITCTVVEGAGHTFRPRAAQAALRRLLLQSFARDSGIVQGATVQRIEGVEPLGTSAT